MKRTTSTIAAIFFSFFFAACGYDPNNLAVSRPDSGTGADPDTDTITAVGDSNPDTTPASCPQGFTCVPQDSGAAEATPDALPQADTVPSTDSIPSDTIPNPTGYVPAKIPAGFKALVMSNLTTKPDEVVPFEVSKAADYLRARGFSVDISRVNRCAAPCKTIVDADGNPIDWTQYQVTYIPVVVGLARLGEVTTPVAIYNGAANTIVGNYYTKADEQQPDEFVALVNHLESASMKILQIGDSRDVDITMPSSQIAAKMTGTVSLGKHGVDAAMTVNLGTFKVVSVPSTAHVVAIYSYKGNDYAALYYYNVGDPMTTITDPRTGLKRTPTATRKIVGFPISIANANPVASSLFDASIDWLLGL